MGGSIYYDKIINPDEQILKDSLGDTYPLYLEICNHIKEDIGSLQHEWQYYGKKNGWLLKMLVKNRNVLFINPQHGYFTTAFTFGEKAVRLIQSIGISDTIKADLQKATKYAEGRTIQLMIKSNDDLADIISLIDYKMNK